MAVFISYAFKDRDFAKSLVEKLAENGIRVWFAEQAIIAGESLTQKIVSQIEQSDTVLILLSKNSVRSEWMSREIALAVAARNAGKQKKIIPILIENGVEVPLLLRDILYLDLSDDSRFEQNFQELIRALADPTTEKWDAIANREAILELVNAQAKALYLEKIHYNQVSRRNSLAIRTMVSLALCVGLVFMVGIGILFFGDSDSGSALWQLLLGCIVGVFIQSFFDRIWRSKDGLESKE